MRGNTILMLVFLFLTGNAAAASFLHNDYSYLQEITFELYTDEVPAYKVPEQTKSIEEMLMFEILHATWKDKHWVAYTLNKDLLGTFKVGQPALLDNDNTKKIFFVAAFPGSVGGLDIYYADFANGSWSKPKNLGKAINTTKNESNPGLLNDHTLTYSSGGIIKKLDLKTFKVVDLEEVSDAPKQAAVTPETIAEKPAEVVKKPEAAPAVADVPAPAVTVTEKPIAQQTETMVVNTPKKPEAVTPAPAAAPVKGNSAVESLGNKTRAEMLKKYQTAIQLGAFSVPKWELFTQFAQYGKLITYKNENNINVVWLTGFSSHAAAESVLTSIKSTPGFENAYITGK